MPSLTAMPAASWPRCCSANRPKKASCATPSPCGVETPNTPHSSCGSSSSGRWVRRCGASTKHACSRKHARLLQDAGRDGVRARLERGAGEALVGLDVAAGGLGPHLGGQRRRLAVAAVAGGRAGPGARPPCRGSRARRRRRGAPRRCRPPSSGDESGVCISSISSSCRRRRCRTRTWCRRGSARPRRPSAGRGCEQQQRGLDAPRPSAGSTRPRSTHLGAR